MIEVVQKQARQLKVEIELKNHVYKKTRSVDVRKTPILH